MDNKFFFGVSDKAECHAYGITMHSQDGSGKTENKIIVGRFHMLFHGAPSVVCVAGKSGVGRVASTARTMWDGHQAARQPSQGKFSHTESMGVHLKSRQQEM